MWFAVIPSACLPLSHATHLNLHSRWVPASYILHNKAQQYLCDENSNAKISITDKKKKLIPTMLLIPHILSTLSH